MPVANHLPRRRVHRPPAVQRDQGIGEGVVALGETRDEEPCARQALGAEPSALEGHVGAFGDGDVQIDVLPVGPRLLHPEGEPEDAGVDLGHLGEEATVPTLDHLVSDHGVHVSVLKYGSGYWGAKGTSAAAETSPVRHRRALRASCPSTGDRSAWW